MLHFSSASVAQSYKDIKSVSMKQSKYPMYKNEEEQHLQAAFLHYKGDAMRSQDYDNPMTIKERQVTKAESKYTSKY